MANLFNLFSVRKFIDTSTRLIDEVLWENLHTFLNTPTATISRARHTFGSAVAARILCVHSLVHVYVHVFGLKKLQEKQIPTQKQHRAMLSEARRLSDIGGRHARTVR